jgi:hypothetical protein
MISNVLILQTLSAHFISSGWCMPNKGSSSLAISPVSMSVSILNPKLYNTPADTVFGVIRSARSNAVPGKNIRHTNRATLNGHDPVISINPASRVLVSSQPINKAVTE